jgi:hypothetical protein
MSITLTLTLTLALALTLTLTPALTYQGSDSKMSASDEA